MELPLSGTVLLVIGGLAFVAVSAVLYFIFRMLKKSVKMAFRLAVVAGFLVIASVGSLSLWWFATAETPKAKPKAVRTR